MVCVRNRQRAHCPGISNSAAFICLSHLRPWRSFRQSSIGISITEKRVGGAECFGPRIAECFGQPPDATDRPSFVLKALAFACLSHRSPTSTHSSLILFPRPRSKAQHVKSSQFLLSCLLSILHVHWLVVSSCPVAFCGCFPCSDIPRGCSSCVIVLHLLFASLCSVCSHCATLSTWPPQVPGQSRATSVRHLQLLFLYWACGTLAGGSSAPCLTGLADSTLIWSDIFSTHRLQGVQEAHLWLHHDITTIASRYPSATTDEKTRESLLGSQESYYFLK